MRYLNLVLLSCLAAQSLLINVASADDEEVFLGQLHIPSEQNLGQGRSAIWTMPFVVTQYVPSRPALAMQSALQAQRDGKFLVALAVLDEAAQNQETGAETRVEMNLLRASFLLQGNQSRQALTILASLLSDPHHAADAYALTTMAYLQRGQNQEALDAANNSLSRAQDSEGDTLPALAQSYALQNAGRLAEARNVMHEFNARTPRSALALAREAELALTLDQTQTAARTLAVQALELDATQPYVSAVNGLTYLIDGKVQQAKDAFETALQRDPKDAKALFGLALAEIKLGDMQAGLKNLQAANESDPGSALILTYLGRVQQQLGQSAAAKESWRSARQADPKDPIPWLYQAQAELQDNHPLAARDSLREAQARTANRAVYRGERLLKEDSEILLANLAETQRQLGLESIAYQTLTDTTGEKSSANLRNQADLLQGQRFGESARRSLLLQSLFNDRPGTVPAALDLYGDGAGLTGASNPQHGVISGLGSSQASYNNYDELFNKRNTVEADATSGSKNNSGGQIRAGVGSNTLGLSYAQLQFKSDGFAPFDNLDNRAFQGILQWRPTPSSQVFVSHQTFNSAWGLTFNPADPVIGANANIWDNSQVSRWGLRKILAEDGSSELRALWSTQQTDQTVNVYDLSLPPNYLSSNYGSSNAQSAELQYRHSGATYSTQWGVQQTTVHQNGWYPSPGNQSVTRNDQLFYAAWQQMLNLYWRLDAELGVGKMDNLQIYNPGAIDNSTYFTPRWLPKLGVVYTPEPGTHLRLAAWKDMDIARVGDASLAPVSLAGFLLNRPLLFTSGELLHAWALGADRQLNPTWSLSAETQQYRTDNPILFGGTQTLFNFQDDESKLALHWQPEGKPWTMSLVYEYEHYQNDPNFSALDSQVNQNLRSEQLNMRWFAGTQWTVNVKWSHNQDLGNKDLSDYTLPFPYETYLPYQESFNQLDADMSWKFNHEHGVLTAGVRNATDKRFQYVEIDKLNPRFSTGRQLYTKLKMVW